MENLRIFDWLYTDSRKRLKTKEKTSKNGRFQKMVERGGFEPPNS